MSVFIKLLINTPNDTKAECFHFCHIKSMAHSPNIYKPHNDLFFQDHPTVFPHGNYPKRSKSVGGEAPRVND